LIESWSDVACASLVTLTSGNIYVKSKRAGQRVRHSISRFITQKLKREGQSSEERGGESMGAAVSWLLLQPWWEEDQAAHRG